MVASTAKQFSSLHRLRACGLTIRSSRNHFAPAKTWRKSVPCFHLRYAFRLNSGVRHHMATRRRSRALLISGIILAATYLVIPFAYMPSVVERSSFRPTTTDKAFEFAYGWLLGQCSKNSYASLVRGFTAHLCSANPGHCVEPKEPTRCGA